MKTISLVVTCVVVFAAMSPAGAQPTPGSNSGTPSANADQLKKTDQSNVDAATSDAASLAATTEKFNADVSYMNRTLRAVDSLDRYKSWVNMKTGPTGHERYIYGLYGVYDVTDERAAAEAALTAKPLLPDLDDAMRAYIAANDTLAPILNKANGYYDRADYKLDHMERGKALHAQIVPAADAFLAARAHLEAVMRVEKGELDRIRLATIEKREGRDADWHVANVMMNAKQTIDALQTGQHGDVDMAAFNADMKGLGDAVRGMDDYNADHPGAFSAFEVFPDQFLGGLRSVQERLTRSHGNLDRDFGHGERRMSSGNRSPRSRHSPLCPNMLANVTGISLFSDRLLAVTSDRTAISTSWCNSRSRQNGTRETQWKRSVGASASFLTLFSPLMRRRV